MSLFFGHNNDANYSPDITTINLGYLYNWFAVDNVKNINNTGWSTPSRADWTTLVTYLIDNGYNYDDTLTGDKYGKSLADEISWWYEVPETGAPGNPDYPAKRNITGMNIRAAGWRKIDGSFIQLEWFWSSWLSEQDGGFPDSAYIRSMMTREPFTIQNSEDKNFGHSIRLIKDSTTLSHGESGTYVGNDGKVYRTICVGTQEWLADNLAETKYQDGTTIPTITDNTAWSNDVTGAKCSYNNNEANV